MNPNQKSSLKNIDPRVFWAKERTFLAWIRTGLALMGLGFVVARFGLFLRMLPVQANPDLTAHGGWSLWFGTLLVLLGVLAQVGSAVDYIRFISILKRGKMPVLKPAVLGAAVALSLGLLGLFMAAYLIADR